MIETIFKEEKVMRELTRCNIEFQAIRFESLTLDASIFKDPRLNSKNCEPLRIFGDTLAQLLEKANVSDANAKLLTQRLLLFLRYNLLSSFSMRGNNTLSCVFLDDNNSNTTGIDVTIRLDEHIKTIYIAINRIDEDKMEDARIEFS